jgi:molybdopterin biosynthesis enzyme
VWVGRQDGHYVAARSGAQASNVLSAMAQANGLAFLPDGDGVPEGGDVSVMRLDWPADH